MAWDWWKTNNGPGEGQTRMEMDYRRPLYLDNTQELDLNNDSYGIEWEKEMREDYQDPSCEPEWSDDL